MIAGLLLAVGCAFAGSVSVLLKQRGAFASLTGNIVALLGGILVFHDPIGPHPAADHHANRRLLPVIIGAALLPGRLRTGAFSSHPSGPNDPSSSAKWLVAALEPNGHESIEEATPANEHERTFEIRFTQTPGIRVVWNRSWPCGQNSRP